MQPTRRHLRRGIFNNSGWDTISNYDFLKDVIKELSEKNIRSSIFIECDNQKIEFAAKIGADRIELYTENYSKEYQLNKQASVIPYVNASKVAMENGLGVNAGHDLDLNNLES